MLLKKETKSIFLDILAELKESLCHVVSSFLADTFKSKSKMLFNLNATSEESDAVEVSKLISCLGIASSFEETQQLAELQKDKSLLIDALYLLKIVHQVGRSDKESSWAPSKEFNLSCTVKV